MFEHAPESKFILKFIVDPKSSFQERKRISRKFILPSATVLYYLLNKNIDERKGNIVCSIRSGERFPLGACSRHMCGKCCVAELVSCDWLVLARVHRIIISRWIHRNYAWKVNNEGVSQSTSTTDSTNLNKNKIFKNFRTDGFMVSWMFNCVVLWLSRWYYSAWRDIDMKVVMMAQFLTHAPISNTIQSLISGKESWDLPIGGFPN